MPSAQARLAARGESSSWASAVCRKSMSMASMGRLSRAAATHGGGRTAVQCRRGRGDPLTLTSPQQRSRVSHTSPDKHKHKRSAESVPQFPVALIRPAWSKRGRSDRHAQSRPRAGPRQALQDTCVGESRRRSRAHGLARARPSAACVQRRQEHAQSRVWN
jgi:hypothetical protein